MSVRFVNTAVILCGGMSTRMGALTSETPKALLNVNGKPIIWYTINFLKQNGVRKFIFPLGYLGEKIQRILNRGSLNKAEIILIEDMGKLSCILKENLDLPKLVIQKILFAMSYFIDENDEIPDIIPEYGYLDDLTVVNWIMEDIQKKLPEVANA